MISLKSKTKANSLEVRVIAKIMNEAVQVYVLKSEIGSSRPQLKIFIPSHNSAVT